MMRRLRGGLVALLLVLAAAGAALAQSAGPAPARSASGSASPPVRAALPAAGSAQQGAGETAQAVRVVVGLTAIALVPALLVCATAFLRIVIVLSLLRQAIGLQDTPPNTVLIGLALFLTLFTMAPVLQVLDARVLQPFLAGQLGLEQAWREAGAPLRDFMVRQTREQDLALMVELAKAPPPRAMEDIGNALLVPAFMLSELRSAFQIGFVIFLPFLLIDLVVASVLMALGMMMMPPATVALPLKLLMFVLVDGWAVVLKALMGSFR